MELKITGRQFAFINAKATEVLFGGAAGGGKSYGQVVDAFLYALKYPASRQLILRRTYPDLERSIILASLGIIPQTVARYNSFQHRWTFVNGSIIEFGYCEHEKDVHRYQGAEYDVIRFDELTHFTEYMYVYLISRLRGSTPYPRSMKSSTNPGNLGHYWVKARFIDIGAAGRVHEISTPRVNKKPVITTRLFLPSLVQDNPFLLEGSPDYMDRLELLPEREREALLRGNWDIFEGQYFTMFRRDVHTFEPFEMPEAWRRYVAFDYGQDMFACYFGALDERENLWIYKEIYRPNLLISEAAELLRSHIDEGEQIRAFFAPPDMWNRQKDTGNSVADIFARNGIKLTRADNRRVQGWYDLAEWLRIRPDGEGRPTARLKIGVNCLNLLKTLPVIQRDEKNPNDCAANPHELTHAPDALRYMVAGRPWAPKERKKTRYEQGMQDLISFGR